MTRSIACCSLAFVLAVGMATVLAADEPRRCAAFVVGVEAYDEAELNNLQYVAEDAYSIWRQLETVTGFDHQLSRLMVAERKLENRDGSDRPLPDKLSASGKQQLFDHLNANQVRDAFHDFLIQSQRADVELVTVYFGGHGIINENAPSEGVRFTASDYESILRGTIRVRDLIADMRSVFGKRSDVDLVFFASMCHAGALAPGEAGDITPPARKYVEASKSDYQEVKNLNLAYFPACGAKASTFERPQLRAGEFAHYLRRGLTGANRKSSGKITTGGLIDYLSQNLKTIPPDLPSFRREIELGLVLSHEARVRRMLGEGLLAVAQDHEGLQRDSFLRLAAQQFRWCCENHHEHKFENTVLQWQANRLRGAETEELRLELEQFAKGDLSSLQAEYRRFAGQLAQSGLERPFLGIVLDTGRTSELDQWSELLSSYPGDCEVRWWKADAYGGASRVWKTEVEQAIATESRQPGALDLVLVYTGSVINMDADTQEMKPIGPRQLWEVARLWSRGRVVLVWDAPFGGYLANVPEDLREKTSLFLSASQTNGMTYRGHLDGNGTTGFITRAFHAGLTPSRLQQLYTDIKTELSDIPGPDQYEIGKPALVGPDHPFFKGPRKSSPSDLGIPAKWWGMTAGVDRSVTSGWGKSVSPVPPGGKWVAIRKRADPNLDGTLAKSTYAEQVGRWRGEIMSYRYQSQDAIENEPFKLLRLATLHEAVGDVDQAVRGFQTFANSIDWQISDGELPADLDRVRARAYQRLRDFGEEIKSRRPVKTGRVHLVPVAAKEYRSPLIGDLGWTDIDTKRWIDSLQAVLGDRLIYEPYIPSTCTSEAIRESLRLACHACKPDEIVVFVFSGRGYQDETDKYLITEEVEFSDTQFAYVNGRAVISYQHAPLSVKSLEQDFGQCAGSSIAIFDCQFADSPVQPLQKQLFATWPISAGDRRAASTSKGTFVDLPDSKLLKIWWAGPLKDSPNEGSELTRQLTAGLNSVARQPYRDLLSQLDMQAASFRPPVVTDGLEQDIADWDPQLICAEGNLGAPVFSVSGSSLVRLLNDHHLKQANLDVVLDLLAETGELLQRQEDILARASLHNARADLIAKSYGRDHQRVKQDSQSVSEQLSQLRSELERDDAAGELDPDKLRALNDADLIPVFFRLVSDRMASDGNADRAIAQAAEMARKVGDDWVDTNVQQRLFELANIAVTEDRRRVLDRILGVLQQAEESDSIEAVMDRIRSLKTDLEIPETLAPPSAGYYILE